MNLPPGRRVPKTVYHSPLQTARKNRGTWCLLLGDTMVFTGFTHNADYYHCSTVCTKATPGSRINVKNHHVPHNHYCTLLKRPSTFDDTFHHRTETRVSRISEFLSISSRNHSFGQACKSPTFNGQTQAQRIPTRSSGSRFTKRPHLS